MVTTQIPGMHGSASCKKGPDYGSHLHIEPANSDGHGAINAHDDQKQSAVLQVQIIMHIEQNAKASKGNEHRYKREQIAVPEAV